VADVHSRPSTEAAWVDIGVDDLTKYRIVEYLYQYPGNEAEVNSLAAILGFHSLEQTLRALEELGQRGVVWIESPPSGLARCGPSTDLALRARVTHLLSLDRDPIEAASLLQHLARRSLARATVRHQGHPAGENGHHHAPRLNACRT